ncbi:MAG: hypothetical protein QNK68_06335 [Flavobacteriales bacterium]
MANTGTKVVLTLRKYVNGVATDETKVNSAGDPDYIAPYQDLVDCPIGGDQTTSTTTTAAPTTAAPTTTTTTIQQNFVNQYLSANCSSNTGGTIIDGGNTYSINATQNFTVPTTGNFDLILTANFTAGPSSVSCFSRVERIDQALVYSQGQVSASTGTPSVSDSDLNVSLTAGDYKMYIYGVACDSSFGSFNLTVTEV